jgi:hypothetical protein
VREFASWPAQGRREKLVDKLLQDGRFTDRWTVFYADMLRLRSNASGGQALIAYVHQAIETGMPYDELARRLIAINGKAGKIPEAGFVLSDDADPLAMASITSQVFLGVRIACAQCHDHPFDVWTRKDFYDLAAYFGKTVALVERADSGGACVHTGTLPSKTLREAALYLTGFQRRELYGMTLDFDRQASVRNLMGRLKSVTGEQVDQSFDQGFALGHNPDFPATRKGNTSARVSQVKITGLQDATIHPIGCQR